MMSGKTMTISCDKNENKNSVINQNPEKVEKVHMYAVNIKKLKKVFLFIDQSINARLRRKSQKSLLILQLFIQMYIQ